MGFFEDCSNIVDALVEHKSVIADYYQSCSQKFKDHSPLWDRLASQERSHSEGMRSIKSMFKPSDPPPFPPDMGVKLLVESSSKFIKRESARMSAKPEYPLRLALSTSLKIADSFFERGLFVMFKDAPEQARSKASEMLSQLESLSKELSATLASVDQASQAAAAPPAEPAAPKAEDSKGESPAEETPEEKDDGEKPAAKKKGKAGAKDAEQASSSNKEKTASPKKTAKKA